MRESKKNNNQYNTNNLNRSDGSSNEYLPNNNGLFRENQLNTGVFNGSQVNNNVLNHNPYYFGEIPNDYQSNFFNAGSNQNNMMFKFDSIDDSKSQGNVMPGFESTSSTNNQGNVMPGFENVSSVNNQGNVMPGFENVSGVNSQGNVMPGFENVSSVNSQGNVMPGFENTGSVNGQGNVMPGFENKDSANNKGKDMAGDENKSKLEDENNTDGYDAKKLKDEPLPEIQNFSKEKIQNDGQSVYADQGFGSTYDGGDQSYNNQQFNGISNQQLRQNQTSGTNYPNENQYQNMQYSNMNSKEQNVGYNGTNLSNSTSTQYQGQFNNIANNNQYPSEQYNNMDPNEKYQVQYNNMNPNGQYQNAQYNSNGYTAQQNMNPQYQKIGANDQYQSINQRDGNYAGSSEDYNLTFVKSWMGNVYEKAHTKKFNFCAALFSGLYLYYRKMYTLGTILLILQLIIYASAATLMPSKVGIIIGIIYCIAIFFGMGFGFYPLYRSFVKGKLNQYKSQTADNNQLIELARQKGGTSIGALIIYVIISLAFSGIVGAMTINQFSQSSTKKQQNIVPNTEDEQVAKMSKYTIDKEYEIEYNSSTWMYNSTSDSLVDGAYTLKYITKYQDTTLGADFTSDTQRSTVLEKLVTSFTNQAATQKMQVESPNSTFIAKNSGYYAYVDVIGTGDISRYYFVILPSEKLLFQFVLTINDTAIDSSVNIDVIDMITKIKKITVSTTTDNNNQVYENTVEGDANVTQTYNNTTLTNETNETNSTTNSSSRTVLSSNVTDNRNITDTTNATTRTTAASNILQADE